MGPAEAGCALGEDFLAAACDPKSSVELVEIEGLIDSVSVV